MSYHTGPASGVAYWSPEEIRALRQVWPRASREDILRALPNRQWYAIRVKAQRLKISRRVHAREAMV